jgi:AbrB family looped-hinge helix DNA binding protein
MYEGYTVVGQRGQITIPIDIRKKINLKEKDKLLVKLKDNYLFVEKINSKEDNHKLMVEGYKLLRKINKETLDDFEFVDNENENSIGDY